jgi:tyrosine-protein kinase Etk/Wzc
MSNKSEQLVDVLASLFRHKTLIRNICLATLVGSLIISFLLPNYYRSYSSFYPASPELSNPEQLFGNTGNITNYFGNEHDLDRLLEIANSNELAEFMIDSFQLYAHYEIDATDKEGPFDVRKKFRKLYNVEKNRFDAIEISIEDKDINLSAPMINAARVKINMLAQKLTRESQNKMLAAFEKNITEKNISLANLNDSIELVKNKYGIYDVSSQGEQLSELSTFSRAQVVQLKAILSSLEKNASIPRDTIAFIQAKLNGYESHLRSLKSSEEFSAASYNKGAPLVQVLQDLHFQARKQLSYDLERYNQIKSTYITEIPALHVIQVGEQPLKKSRPKRSILVLVAVLGAFVFTCLGILLSESFREMNWQRISNGKG